MGKHRPTSTKKIAGGVLLGAVASALAATALSGAGTASASCASLNGQSIGKGCTATDGGASLALGQGAKADARGQGSVALAIGNIGPNPFYGGPVSTTAKADGPNSTAIALGDGSVAGNYGDHNTSIVVGRGSNALIPGVPTINPKGEHDYLAAYHGTAIALGRGREAGAVGNGANVVSVAVTKGRHLDNGLNQK